MDALVGVDVIEFREAPELLDAERASLAATPTWLGGRLRLNSASVTALVDRLERTGHVQRHRESADRRRVSLTITDRAKRLGEAFFGPLIDQVMTIMDGYEPRDRDTIMRFLAEIAAAIPASELAQRSLAAGPPELAHNQELAADPGR